MSTINLILLIFVLVIVSPEIRGDLNKVCYENFGCFTWTRYVPYTPESPEKIGAKFRVYTSDDVTGNRTVSYHNTSNYNLFDNKTSIAFVIHGWLDNGQEHWYTSLFPPLLSLYDVMISVDWHKGAAGLFYPKNVANTQLTGREIGYLLSLLHSKQSINLNKVHLIGFSLGAHVAGQAGRWAKSEYNLTVGRITALDAAGPLIDGTIIHINKSDANYVDSIHSSAGKIGEVIIGRLGTVKAFGHKDFYPNGGSNQPFCPPPLLDMTCRHYAAIKFFQSSMESCDFHATQCDSWKDFKQDKCPQPHVTARMGYYSFQDKEEGSYYLETTKTWPYC